MTPDIRPAPPTLTARQQEVAQLVAAGYTRPEIAARLGLSPATVKRHLEDISDRLPGTDTLRVRATRYMREMEDAPRRAA